MRMLIVTKPYLLLAAALPLTLALFVVLAPTAFAAPGAPAPLTPAAGKTATGVVVVEPDADGTYADEDEWN